VAAGHGAFGHLAQLLALIGLFAGLVSVREIPPGEEGGTLPDEEAPTAPLPHRLRGSSPLGAQPPEPAPASPEEKSPPPEEKSPPSAAGPTVSARGPGQPDGGAPA
jgi:arabinofuranan 3-O-arabinosyltransferase